MINYPPISIIFRPISSEAGHLHFQPRFCGTWLTMLQLSAHCIPPLACFVKLDLTTCPETMVTSPHLLTTGQ
jgi:hypothetical protein